MERSIFLPFCSHFLINWKAIITSVFCASHGSSSLIHRQKNVEGHCSALTNMKQSSLSLWMQFVKSFLFSGLSSDSQPLFLSCSLPSQGLSAAPCLPSGLVCFFCTCVALFTQKQFCLAWCQSPHSPGNQGIILHPLMEPWCVLSPTLIMELRLWAYSCCQAVFHA